MKLSLLYNQKIIVINQKKEENIQKISDIFCASLEKYKNYLEFFKQDKKNKDKEEVKNSKKYN